LHESSTIFIRAQVSLLCNVVGHHQVASFHMFTAGAFSSDSENPHQVDSVRLKNLTLEAIRKGFQVVSTVDTENLSL